MALEGIVQAYARRVKKGYITIDDVPKSLRERVKEALEQD